MTPTLSVLLCPEGWPTREADLLGRLEKACRQAGIELAIQTVSCESLSGQAVGEYLDTSQVASAIADHPSLPPTICSQHIRESLLAYTMLKEFSTPAELVLVPSLRGFSFFTVLAVAEGLLRREMRVGVIADEFHEMTLEIGQSLPSSVGDLEIRFMQSHSLEYADFVLCDDAPLRDYLASVEPGCQDRLFTSDSWEPNHGISDREVETEKPATPLVSICLTHYNRPALLGQALDSLLVQDYSPFEIVLVDDGSTDQEAIALLDKLYATFSARDWPLIRQENRYLGAARNVAARHAKGQFILFFDDDNVAQPTMVSRLVRAATRTGADIVTACMDSFCGDEKPTQLREASWRYVPLGGAPLVGFFWNCYGDASGLIRREVYMDIGGCSERRGLGAIDYELYVKATLAGKRILPLPEALYFYRMSPNAMSVSTNLYKRILKVLDPYKARIPEEFWPVALLARGMADRARETEKEIEELNKSRARLAAMERDPLVRAYWRLRKMASRLPKLVMPFLRKTGR